MKIAGCVVALLLLVSIPAVAQQPGFQDTLLDQLAGHWILEGTIAGDEVVHDVLAEWVLDHQYLRFHEVARERDPDGTPLYEATVYIGWDQTSGQYACLWLDSTGGGGLSAQAIGHTKPGGDDLPFVFDTGDGSFIHNTFAYSRETDTWQWLIDNENDGDRAPFARVTLTRQ